MSTSPSSTTCCTTSRIGPPYLKNLARYIKPAGRIALIEFHPELGGHRNQPELQVSKDKAASLMAEAGFKPVDEINLFTDKYFVLYGRR